MSGQILIEHRHEPVFRIIRVNWTDPLDASFSQSSGDNRWNTGHFPALYCCCSEVVAKAVAEDVFAYTGVNLSDLQPEYRPQVVRISWSGDVVDVISAQGIQGVGLPIGYPAGADKSQTRNLAEQWVRDGSEGVVCRSASMMKKGLSNWNGVHEPWGELAVFVSEAKTRPSLISRVDLDLS